MQSFPHTSGLGSSKDYRCSLVAHTVRLCLCVMLQLQARMKANMGPAFDRVIFYPRLPNSDTFMSFISVVDVLLHPFPFDGSKTAADGLAMGIPVVTWPSVSLCASAATSAVLCSIDNTSRSCPYLFHV